MRSRNRPPSATRVPGTAVLPAVAVLLVVYGYGYALPSGTSPVLRTVRQWANVPLGIGDDFGFLGIAILLVLAGYGSCAWPARRDPEFADRVRPLVVLGTQLGCCYPSVLVPATALSGGAHYVGVLVTVLVLPVFGEVVWFAGHGLLASWQAGCAGVLCLLLAVLSDADYDVFAGRWYSLTMVYAALAVLLVARFTGPGTRRTTARADTIPIRRPDYYHGLDVLRVIASTLVVYTHVCNWFAVSGVDWPALARIEHHLRGAFHLNRHLSMFGVFTFLLISGVVVTHVAHKESVRTFLWRRASRVLPLMVVVTTIVWLFMYVGVDVGDTAPRGLTVSDLLANLDFSAFFSSRDVFMLAVTWTLLIQLVFYTFVAVTIPWLRSRPWLAPAAGTVLCCCLVSFAADRNNPALDEIAGIGGYLPVLFLGQLVALLRTSRISPAVAATLGTADYLIVTWADYLGNAVVRPVDASARTLVMVLGVVALTMTVRNTVTTSRLVLAWSRRTYAIYLINSCVMFPLLDLLVPWTGPVFALLVSLVAIGLLADLLYRFVERPINEAIRSRRKPRRQVPTSGGGTGGGRIDVPAAPRIGS